MSSLVLAPNTLVRTPIIRPANPYMVSFFPLFSSLPPEIRLSIWVLNLPGARLVSVHYTVETGEFYTTTISPVNLRICRESRKEAWRYLGLHFGTCGHPPMVRANLDIDTIQLDWNPIRLGLVDKLDISRIRYLEIGGKDLQREQEKALHHGGLPALTKRLFHQLLTFPKLEVITIASPPLPDHILPPIITDNPMPWHYIAEYLEFRHRRRTTYSYHLRLAAAFQKAKGTLLSEGRKVPM
ncbi:hypothetical protein EG329_001411 [Mollisiaceae sp. DMI_Dod_QoI]|nr:hypothetical protein EG329_001411 [Helotiales sp. DMI_Dod_QoI]